LKEEEEKEEGNRLHRKIDRQYSLWVREEVTRKQAGPVRQ
jgi:hypothetical protein